MFKPRGSKRTSDLAVHFNELTRAWTFSSFLTVFLLKRTYAENCITILEHSGEVMMTTITRANSDNNNNNNNWLFYPNTDNILYLQLLI